MIWQRKHKKATHKKITHRARRSTHQDGSGIGDDILNGIIHLFGGRKNHHGKGVSLAGGRTRRYHGTSDYTDRLNAIPSYNHSIHKGGALKLAGMGHHASPLGHVDRGHAHMVIRH